MLFVFNSLNAAAQLPEPVRTRLVLTALTACLPIPISTCIEALPPLDPDFKMFRHQGWEIAPEFPHKSLSCWILAARRSPSLDRRGVAGCL